MVFQLDLSHASPANNYAGGGGGLTSLDRAAGEFGNVRPVSAVVGDEGGL